MGQKTRYAFVILNWNGKQDTKECLLSIDKISYPLPFDIVVVDNGSDDGSLSYLKKVADSMNREVTFVALEKNTGFTGGHIEGLSHTKADIVCLLNNDAVVASNILGEADVVIQNLGGEFGAIGGRAYFWNNEQSAFDIWNEFFTFQKIDPITATAYTIKGDPSESLAPKIVDNVSGACVFVNREAINKAGYLDNNFFAYYEETDMFARFKRLGYEIFYCPTIRYWHRFDPKKGSHGASSGHLKNFSSTLIARNQFYFAVKNFEPNYLLRFLVWYYSRFIKSLFKLALKRGRSVPESIIVKTTLLNIAQIPSLVRSRKKFSEERALEDGYNTIIIKQSQKKTVVFESILEDQKALNYMLQNTDDDHRVHLLTEKECKIDFEHRCFKLNLNSSSINAISASSSRTHHVLVINSSEIPFQALKRAMERSISVEKPYQKLEKYSFTFNKAFVSQISDKYIGINESIDWAEKPKLNRFDRISSLANRLSSAVKTVRDYISYRLRTGGTSDALRSVLGIVRNLLFNRPKALVIIRDGAHRQRLYNERITKPTSDNKISQVKVEDIPVFINCRDRVQTLKKTIDKINQAGFKKIILLDNQSTYPDLLDFYNNTHHQVILLGENMGHKAPWESGAVKLLSEGKPYVVTDPDVVLSKAYEKSTVEAMLNILDEYPGYVKIGPALRIDDLPDHYEHKQTVQKWEAQFWTDRLSTDSGLEIFDAEIDTTFAIYKPNLGYITLPSIRVGGEFTAMHLPWYDNSSKPNKEEDYYKKHASSAVNTWNKDSLPDYLKEYSN